MQMQNKTVDKQDIANEISKYISDVGTLHPFSKMYIPAIEVEDYGFTPIGVRDSDILVKSIAQSLLDENIYIFSAEGLVSYKDNASGIIRREKAKFSGIVEIAWMNKGFKAVKVEINTIGPSYPQIPNPTSLQKD